MPASSSKVQELLKQPADGVLGAERNQEREEGQKSVVAQGQWCNLLITVFTVENSSKSKTS